MRTALVVLLVWVLTACSSRPSTPRAVASAQVGPTHLAVDLSYVYWTVPGPGGTLLLKTLKEESNPAVQVTTVAGRVQELEVDDDGLYLVIGGAGDQGPDVIRKVAKKPGFRPKDLATSATKVTGLALDATHVYWTQQGNPAETDDTLTPGVLRTMRSGGTPFNLVTRQVGIPCNLALSATHVFWVNAQKGAPYRIMSVRKGGGAPTELIAVPAEETGDVAPALAADDTSVYFKTRRTVVRIGSGGGQPIKLGAVQDSDVTWVAIDTRYFYFQGPGSLLRMPLAGGSATDLATGVGKEIAVDARAVYWLAADSIMQISKN
jgi:hypothetical protein